MGKGNIINGECIYKHGMSRTRFYNIWLGIIKRCENKNCIAYKDYGGRGIKVCEEWKDFSIFKNDMYEKYVKHASEHGEKNTSIERVNNESGYNKSNCVWSTRKEQNNNNRRVKKYHLNGEFLSLAEICDKLDLEYNTIYFRIRRGWDFEKAIETPKMKPGMYERGKKNGDDYKR